MGAHNTTRQSGTTANNLPLIVGCPSVAACGHFSIGGFASNRQRLAGNRRRRSRTLNNNNNQRHEGRPWRVLVHLRWL